VRGARALGHGGGLTAAGPPASAAEYFDAVRAGFAAAAAARGTRAHDLAVAGAAVKLRFAGTALTSLVVPPLAHLPSRVEDGSAATAYLWDSESTGIALPVPPWRRGHIDQRWEVRGFGDGRIGTQQDPEAGVLTMVDRMSRTRRRGSSRRPARRSAGAARGPPNTKR